MIARVPVRIYTPVNKNDDSAMIVFFHGGGFATGNVGKCLQTKAMAHHIPILTVLQDIDISCGLL